MKNEIRKTLSANVGQRVTIEVESFENDCSKVGFSFAGVLEDSDGGNFFVRVGEDYSVGATGVSFQESHIQEITVRKVTSEARIIIKALEVA